MLNFFSKFFLRPRPGGQTLVIFLFEFLNCVAEAVYERSGSESTAKLELSMPAVVDSAISALPPTAVPGENGASKVFFWLKRICM